MRTSASEAIFGDMVASCCKRGVCFEPLDVAARNSHLQRSASRCYLQCSDLYWRWRECHSVEPIDQVCNQVVTVFDPDRQPHQRLTNASCSPRLLVHRGVGHGRRMRDETLYSAE